MSERKVTIIKCPCGHEFCRKYWISEGSFTQGDGWTKERAEEIALAINVFDEEKQREAKREEYRGSVIEGMRKEETI